MSDGPILLRHFRGHHGMITGLAYNPHTNKIASSSVDKSVNLWNTDDKVRCYKFTGHSDVVNSVAWSHSGSLMATASKDNSIKVWVPTIRGSSATLNALSNVRSVEFHPNDKKVGRIIISSYFSSKYVNVPVIVFSVGHSF